MTGAAPNLKQVTPFIYVPNLEAAIAFFESLGFQHLYRMNDYAYVHREGVGFRMLEQPNDWKPAERRFAHYVDVEDVDALFAELKPVLDKMPAKDVHGPVDQEYRQREFMVLAPDGGLLVFGQAIGDQAPST